jgi:hypothetical protein
LANVAFSENNSTWRLPYSNDLYSKSCLVQFTHFITNFPRFQSNSTISAANTKVASCTVIAEMLAKFKEIPVEDSENMNKVYQLSLTSNHLQELQQFCAKLVTIQSSLAKALFFIPEPKDDKPKDKGVTAAFKKVSEKMAKGVTLVRSKEKL